MSILAAVVNSTLDAAAWLLSRLLRVLFWIVPVRPRLYGSGLEVISPSSLDSVLLAIAPLVRPGCELVAFLLLVLTIGTYVFVSGGISQTDELLPTVRVILVPYLCFVAYILHRWKKMHQISYGAVEAILGCFIAWTNLSKAASESSTANRTAIVLGGVYLIKRGIDSISEGMVKKGVKQRML